MKPAPAPAAPPLPDDLPAPVDDGAAAHLTGQLVPHIRLKSTDGSHVDLAELAAGSLVLFVFPRIGRPGAPSPEGWDQIPGARGCTQQTCGFRDRHDEFRALGYAVAGVSAQPAEEQQEASRRLRLPFRLLADPEQRLAELLKLPTFRAAGMALYKRLTLVAREGRIVKVFYPVFPPDRNAGEVLEWIGTADRRRP
jgi:peroxiredoxin